MSIGGAFTFILWCGEFVDALATSSVNRFDRRPMCIAEQMLRLHRSAFASCNPLTGPKPGREKAAHCGLFAENSLFIMNRRSVRGGQHIARIHDDVNAF